MTGPSASEPTPRPFPQLGTPARDHIDLVGVRAWGHHGVLPHETEAGQEFTADVRLWLDTRPAAAADALGRTVNYAEVADVIVQGIHSGPHLLIETLANQLASQVLASPVLVRRVELTVHKPSAPIPHPFADVAVRVVRDAAPTTAVLALGTNIGDREDHLRRALDLLEAADGVDVIATGPVIETDPVGGVEQAAFLNSVVCVRTTRGPWELLELAHVLEADARRVREIRWGPRTLDVDVLTFGDLVQDDPDLTLPHPRVHERAFALAPWDRMDPSARVPGHGAVADLLMRAPDREGVRPGPEVGGFGHAVPWQESGEGPMS
jgi:dihydroneopterin aldolase/2-amino-4-hydroxy-6-hydroxymethyldihydropteridine diphosphokinase